MNTYEYMTLKSNQGLIDDDEDELNDEKLSNMKKLEKTKAELNRIIN